MHGANENFMCNELSMKLWKRHGCGLLIEHCDQTSILTTNVMVDYDIEICR